MASTLYLMRGEFDRRFPHWRDFWADSPARREQRMFKEVLAALMNGPDGQSAPLNDVQEGMLRKLLDQMEEHDRQAHPRPAEK